ncbi:MAG: DUF327 family protein [Spirochaetales bacterium]|nr:DUF327 family protein [Spirochaetales bacterium]HNQ96827.1 DUF327 family protein [Treponemataceae bacterium]
MANPVDPVSPFFSSIAGQAGISALGAKAAGAKKNKEPVKRFDRLVQETLSTESEAQNIVLPERLQGLSSEKILEGLLDDVHSAGDALKERSLPEHIRDYKNAVRFFVRYVVDKSFTVTETTSGGNILKRKKFTQIQVIDEKLEQLAREILSNQRNQMAVLARIEEINGLLVDLLS